jgi:hypothetical protein
MKIGAVMGIKYFTHAWACPIVSGNSSAHPRKIYFEKNQGKKSVFPTQKNLHFYRLKIEHHPYMLRTPIFHVKILSHFDHFFNGGFS